MSPSDDCSRKLKEIEDKLLGAIANIALLRQSGIQDMQPLSSKIIDASLASISRLVGEMDADCRKLVADTENVILGLRSMPSHVQVKALSDLLSRIAEASDVSAQS